MKSIGCIKLRVRHAIFVRILKSRTIGYCNKTISTLNFVTESAVKQYLSDVDFKINVWQTRSMFCQLFRCERINYASNYAVVKRSSNSSYIERKI